MDICTNLYLVIEYIVHRTAKQSGNTAAQRPLRIQIEDVRSPDHEVHDACSSSDAGPVLDRRGLAGRAATQDQ